MPIGRISSNTTTSAHHASAPASTVASSSGERADAAYDRALRAFDERSYDVARSWALQALNEDPQHAGARALLTRLDAARPSASPFEPPIVRHERAREAPTEGAPGKGPEPISTDPNVLISRASGSETREPIEPTDDHPARRPASPPARVGRTGAGSAAAEVHRLEPPVAEPTVIDQPRPRAASCATRRTILRRRRFRGAVAVAAPPTGRQPLSITPARLLRQDVSERPRTAARGCRALG